MRHVVGCTTLLGALLALTAVAPRAGAALPVPYPGFTDSICQARPPAMAHAWARGLQVVPPGSVLRVAEKTFSNEDNADLMFKLGLLEGHLIVGRQLIEAGQPAAALPHFGHPVRELYDDIKDALQDRGITGFDSELITLEALAAGKPNDPATAAEYDKVVRILNAVRATVPAGLRDDERFMGGVLSDVTETAASDFNESVEAGRIAKVVEYHDSHGYLVYADRELTRLENRPGGKESRRLAGMRAVLTEMQGIVGPLLPSERPAKTVAEYRALVAKMKAVATAA